MRLNSLLWIVVLCFAPAVHAQLTETKPTTRPMSLDDCIRMALERNLAMQLGGSFGTGAGSQTLSGSSSGKIGLEQTQLNLERRLGEYYDPLFSARAGQSYRSQPGGFDPGSGIPLPGEERWTETFGLGLNGNLPAGTRYSFSAGLNRTSSGENNTNAGSFAFQYGPSFSIGVTQPLLKDFWVDAGRLSIRLARNSLKQSEHSFRLLVMTIVRNVADKYYLYLGARDEIKVREKALELAEQLVSENKKKVAVGTMAPLDERQAESQAARAKSDLTEAIYAAQVAENDLKAIITHDFADIQPVNIEPTEKLIAIFQSLSLAESWRTALGLRPDYLNAKENLERQKIALVYYKNQLFPALDLQATYGRNGLGNTTSDSLETIDNNRFPNFGGFVVLTVPLSRKAERAAYQSAKLDKERAILGIKLVEDEVLQAVDLSVKEVTSRYQTTQSRRQERIYAEEALEAEQKKLENGKSTSFQVLQFQRDLTTASSAEIEAIADYNRALQQFYLREGTILDRNKITLELK
jgi:outer membrane protein TolC